MNAKENSEMDERNIRISRKSVLKIVKIFRMVDKAIANNHFSKSVVQDMEDVAGEILLALEETQDDQKRVNLEVIRIGKELYEDLFKEYLDASDVGTTVDE